MSKKKKEEKTDKEEKTEELQNFDIKINEFGEIITNYKIDDINEFLNENVDDKKFRNKKEEEE